MSDTLIPYRRRGFIRTAVPVLVLLVAVGIGAVLLKTPPQVPKSERPKLAAVVGVANLDPQRVPTFVQAFGTVIAARETRVQPEVTGRIVAMHPQLIPGGLIRQEEALFDIDRADYEIAVQEATAEVEVSRLQTEGLRAGIDALRGRVRQLEAELEYLRWNMDRLGNLSEQEQAGQAESRDAQSKYEGQKAAISALQAQIVEQQRAVDRAAAQTAVAENRLASAELALSRTRVVAPFDAIVLNEAVEMGQLIGPQTTAATLAATDQFWVEASIPVARLKNIRFAEGGESNGSSVEVTLNTGDEPLIREGVVLRSLGQLDPQGRMAQIVVAIRDPLDLKGSQHQGKDALLLGSYVRLCIAAGVIEDVYAIPRYALRENSRVWVRNAAHNLAIRHVEIVWRRQEDVLVRNGFEAGDQLITTHLASVVPGMPLDVRDGDSVATTTTDEGPVSSGS